jgi:hypothetical protein
MLKLSKNCFCQKKFVVNENEASFEIFGNSFVQMKSSKSNNYSAETQTDLPLNFGMIHSKKEGLQKDGAIHGETLCLPTLDLSKMAPHTMCVCAHQHRLVKNGAMLGVWVCINTDLSKLVLCSGCGCAH